MLVSGMTSSLHQPTMTTWVEVCVYIWTHKRERVCSWDQSPVLILPFNGDVSLSCCCQFFPPQIVYAVYRLALPLPFLFRLEGRGGPDFLIEMAVLWQPLNPALLSSVREGPCSLISPGKWNQYWGFRLWQGSMPCCSLGPHPEQIWQTAGALLPSHKWNWIPAERFFSKRLKLPEKQKASS